MNRVYAVVGYMREEGEDVEWIVAIYPDQERAEQDCKLPQQAINEAFKNCGSLREDIKIIYDDSIFHWHQIHVSYSVKESIFVRHMDEYLEQE